MSSQEKFLLQNYNHLSELWRSRDGLRIAFLRFYFLFLGGVVTVVGFVVQRGRPDLCLFQLMANGVVKMLLFVSIAVGIMTFCLILFIRLHNLRCMRDMLEVAKRLYEHDRRFCVSNFTGSL